MCGHATMKRPGSNESAHAHQIQPHISFLTACNGHSAFGMERLHLLHGLEPQLRYQMVKALKLAEDLENVSLGPIF